MSVLGQRIERARRISKQYESSVSYWSNPARVISRSDRHDQSREFLVTMTEHCKNQLIIWESRLAELVRSSE